MQAQQEIWADSFDDSDDESIEEEYNGITLNLGAETPHSVSGNGTPGEQYYRHPDDSDDDSLPLKAPIWRSRSFDRKKKANLSSIYGRNSRSKSPFTERECKICFSLAKNPSRTSCCGSVFCLEHIVDWLQGSSVSESRCPVCNELCRLSADVAPVTPQMSVQTSTIPKDILANAAPLTDHKTRDGNLGLGLRQHLENPAIRTPYRRSPSPSPDSSDSEDSFDSRENRSSWGSVTSKLEQLISDPKETVSGSVSKSKSFAHDGDSFGQELFSRLFTLVGLGMVLYILLNGQNLAV